MLKKQYRPKCELIYTDTDNLFLEIQTEDVYKDMEASKYHFDSSDFPNLTEYNNIKKSKGTKLKRTKRTKHEH